MKREITFKGEPLRLVGRCLEAGMSGPDFRVVSSDFKEMKLADFGRKIKIITTFLSLDTPVCDLQVKEFNRRAIDLGKDVVILGISKDLPFAQKRFCKENAIVNVVTLSDYRFSSFGINYGMLIKELNLLARGVLILDTNDIVRYVQVVEEATDAPDYDAVLKTLQDVLEKPALPLKEEIPRRCSPCEKGTPPLSKDSVETHLQLIGGWELVDDRKIRKEYKFKDFIEAKYFLDLVSAIAEEQGHHPTMTIMYNRLRVTLTTHAAGGLTENDFIMARIVDELV
jgi:thiol peroxidase